MPKFFKRRLRIFTTHKVLSIVLLIVVALAALRFFHATPLFHKTESANGGGNKPVLVTKSGSKVDLSPGTPAEQQQVDNQKSQQAAEPTKTSKKVSVFITSVNLPVRAYASGIIEDGGTCTATFTKGSTVVTKSTTGLANVSYTSCPPISPSLAKGTWSVTVSYKSATASGQSEPETIAVQ